jgi:hypothetical protein
VVSRKSRLQLTRERIAAQVQAAVEARPDTSLLRHYEGFWDHLREVSSSEEAARRNEAARLQMERMRQRVKGETV